MNEEAGVKAEDGDGMKGAKGACESGDACSVLQAPKGLGPLLAEG